MVISGWAKTRYSVGMRENSNAGLDKDETKYNVVNTNERTKRALLLFII